MNDVQTRLRTSPLRRTLLERVLLAGIFSCLGCDASPLDVSDATQPIINGEATFPGEFPYQARIRTSIGHRCGGTLIRPDWVLTAAHCLDGFETNELRVVLGDHDRLDIDGNEQFVDIAEWFVHPGYQQEGAYSNDIALIRLVDEATLNELTQPIDIVRENDGPHQDATVTGWGRTEFGGSSSQFLQKTTLPIRSNAACNNYLPTRDLVAGELCTGYAGGSTTTCSGDSGSPVVILNTLAGGEQELRVAGVVSWGFNDCGTYSVSARVSHFAAWIDGLIGADTPSDSDCIDQHHRPNERAIIAHGLTPQVDAVLEPEVWHHPGVVWNTIGPERHFGFRFPLTPEGGHDASGQFALVSDDDSIYLAVEVNDDVVGGVADVDGIEIYIDAGYERFDRTNVDAAGNTIFCFPPGSPTCKVTSCTADWCAPGYDFNDVQLSVRSNKTDQNGNDTAAAWDVLNGRFDASQIREWQVQETERGYVIEMRLPYTWGNRTLQPSEGTTIGLEFAINDDDCVGTDCVGANAGHGGDPRQHQLFWSNSAFSATCLDCPVCWTVLGSEVCDIHGAQPFGIEPWRNPSIWGEATFCPVP